MLKKLKTQEKDIIASIQKGGFALQQTMRYIYQQSGAKETVFNYIFAQKGGKEDAEDIFQEGICAFVLNIQRRKFEGRSAWKTYLVGICKNLWKAKFETIKRQTQLKTKQDKHQTFVNNPEHLYLEKEQKHTLQKVLSLLGSKCERLLMLWLKSYSIKEITQQTVYKNENVVSKKKHQCLKKLYQLMEENPILRKSLIK